MATEGVRHALAVMLDTKILASTKSNELINIQLILHIDSTDHGRIFEQRIQLKPNSPLSVFSSEGSTVVRTMQCELCRKLDTDWKLYDNNTVVNQLFFCFDDCLNLL